MEEPEQLDLDPRARDLVVEVIGIEVAIYYDALQPRGGFHIDSFVLILVVLGQCHHQGCDRQCHTHVDVVKEGDNPLCPLRLDDVRMFAVQAQECKRCLFPDKSL